MATSRRLTERESLLTGRGALAITSDERHLLSHAAEILSIRNLGAADAIA
jgi:hypothetical protein